MMRNIAYRMLGSMSEAEDVVQDAYFRWLRVDPDKVDSSPAYLASTVTRLCIDKLRRRKIEKLNYIGPWLPEPLIDEVGSGDELPQALEMAESISIAFLHLLEGLAPLERAVFILREAFDLAHEEIATTLHINPPHARQLHRRAKAKLGNFSSAAAPASEPHAKEVLHSFLEAAVTGNLEGLKALLADDIIAYSDGGGRVPAALIPLVGVDKVCTVLLHLLGRQQEPLTFRWGYINDSYGLIVYQGEAVHSVTTAEVRDGKIRRLFTTRNPGKLTRLNGLEQQDSAEP